MSVWDECVAVGGAQRHRWLFDRWEPIIRADERHFLHSRGLRSVARVERDLADLRAKVEGLGLSWSDSGGFRWVRQADVLALLEEKPHEYTRAQSGWGNQLHLPEDEND